MDPTDDSHHEKHDGNHQAEIVGRNKRYKMSIKTSGNRGINRAEDKDLNFQQGKIYTHGAGCGFAAVHGTKSPSDSGVNDIQRKKEGQKINAPDQVIKSKTGIELKIPQVEARNIG